MRPAKSASGWRENSELLVSSGPEAKRLYSRLHVAKQLEASRGFKKQLASKARRPSLRMIEADVLITPEMDGVKVVVLLIGNAKYVRVKPLRNPGNDVGLLAKVARAIKGALVIEVLDGTKSEMDDAIARFEAELGPGVIAIFGFAGHGLQVDGINHLVPVDYENPTGDKSLLKKHTVSLQHTLQRMEDKNTLANMCIIDGVSAPASRAIQSPRRPSPQPAARTPSTASRARWRAVSRQRPRQRDRCSHLRPPPVRSPRTAKVRTACTWSTS